MESAEEGNLDDDGRPRRTGRRHIHKGAKSYQKEYTVFVANLPSNLDQYGLKGVFRKVGQVSDSYIPRRRSGRNAYWFGFVRFIHALRQIEVSLCLTMLS